MRIIKVTIYCFAFLMFSKFSYDHFIIYGEISELAKKSSVQMNIMKNNERRTNAIELKLNREGLDSMQVLNIKSPSLVLYLNDFMCNSCINNELNNISELIKRNQTLIVNILYETTNNLQIEKLNLDLGCNVVKIKGVPTVLKTNVPMYFYYNSNVTNVFIPSVKDRKRTQAYLDMF
ncbi:MAG: hypothetical protein JEZ14_14105 [Marinilabiliaceae bacterium]|nr:hypothetical protein [Marinilabiliaceae bacterium]